VNQSLSAWAPIPHDESALNLLIEKYIFSRVCSQRETRSLLLMGCVLPA